MWPGVRYEGEDLFGGRSSVLGPIQLVLDRYFVFVVESRGQVPLDGSCPLWLLPWSLVPMLIVNCRAWVMQTSGTMNESAALAMVTDVLWIVASVGVLYTCRGAREAHETTQRVSRPRWLDLDV